MDAKGEPNYNNKLVICFGKYFQTEKYYLFDITDEHIVLSSNNLEPAIHEQIMLAAENGTIVRLYITLKLLAF